MLDALTVEDVRRQDAECEARGIPVERLMERAGFGVARAARAMLGYSYGMRVVVVCGKGNNAGDGLVAGRWLAHWGAHVVAVMALGRELRGAAGANLARFPGPVVDAGALDRELARADLVIDALFGVGLSRAPGGEAARAIDAINGAGAPVISIDVPSGMDADTGDAPGAVVRADGIVTLGGLKPGLLFHADVADWVEIADIGVPRDLRIGSALVPEASDVASLLPLRAPGGHKRDSGTVLVVAGSRAMPGAAALTAGACVHAGAGLTTLAATERVTAVALSRVPEMTTIVLPDSPEGALDDKGAEIVLERADQFSAIAIGPGLSRHPATAEAVRRILLSTDVPAVVDADAIVAFAGGPGALRERRGFTVLTPHGGEAAALLGAEAADLRADRIAAARRIARETGQVALLKGPGTVVCGEDGPVYLNATGNRGLAQGGTGDVLTGVIAALLAQGGDAPDETRTALVAAGAWLHGRAADITAESVAPHPTNASLLIETLPAAIHGVFA